MDLRNSLRHAAELFVELPPEEPDASRTVKPLTASNGSTAEEDEIDRQLAQQRQAIERLNSGIAAAASTAPRSPAPLTDKPLPQIPTSVATSAPAEAGEAPPFAPDGALDFAAIYQNAALPAAPFTAEQTLRMIQSLPADLPMPVRRQTALVAIDAMGKSIGATPETIAADASHKLAALTAFAESIDKRATEFASAAEFEIQLMTAQIEEKRKGVAAAQEKAAAVQSQCRAEAERLEEVLGFLSRA